MHPLCVIALAVVFSAPPAANQRRADFAADPGWDARENRLLPDPLPVIRQDFGYSETRHAGGRGAGEIGGRVQRSITPATYSVAVAARTLDDRLTASGRFAVTQSDNGAGALCGWFHESSRGWRTPNSLAFRIDGNGGKYWVLFEYGTRLSLTKGGATFEGRYQTTKTKPFPADGTVHEWSLDYDPDGGEGHGGITFTLDGTAYPIALPAEHRKDGAEFNRFGIWNQQLYGDALELYLDDLVIDGRAYAFDDDPGWIGRDSRAQYGERFVRPRHDFGFSPTRHAGGAAGEVGGVFWRGEPPAYYADAVGPLSLDDELTASGRICFRSAGVDSALHFGWFRAEDVKRPAEKDADGSRNCLGIALEGPSRVGHYFRPEYATADGTHRSRDDGPVLRPDAQPHTWSLHYDPDGAEGRGRITFRLDDEEATWDLEPGDRQRGATFDRFGLVVLPTADGHFVEAYLDDLTYTAGRP